MKEYAVSDVVAMLQVNEETVRRWIRKGKLPATRRVGRGGNLIVLEDIVGLSNRKPHIYHEPMIQWLRENNIEFSLQEELQDVDTVNKPYLKDRYGFLYGRLSGTISVPKIVLHSSSEEKEVDCESDTDTGTEPSVVCSEEIKQQDAMDVAIDDATDTDIKEKIFAEKKKLIRLEQDLARINAEISVCRGEIEYYSLLLQEKK